MKRSVVCPNARTSVLLAVLATMMMACGMLESDDVRVEAVRRSDGGTRPDAPPGDVPPVNPGVGGGGSSCPAGQTKCRGRCVDLQADSNHCGVCGNACGTGAACSSGQCCPSGQMGCNGVCIDPSNDEDNCGGCGIQCAVGEICSDSQCVCYPGTVRCNGECVLEGSCE